MNLTASKIAEKIKKFAIGKKSEEDKTETDGKLIKNDDDDEKEELETATIWKTMKLAGGWPAWVLIVLSFIVTSGFGKFRDFETKNIYT